MQIEHYSFGNIRIDGKDYGKDVIVFPDRVQEAWWRKDGHSLVPEDLDTVVAAAPRLLIVGLGCYGAMRIPGETIRWLEEKGIEVRAAHTAEAVNLYNSIEDKKGTVAGFHLTC
jgi:hypothetical protein